MAALLTSSDFPAGLVTPQVLANLGGDPAIDAASRQAWDEMFVVIGGKYKKVDSGVSASPGAKAILLKKTFAQLLLNDELLRVQNAGLIELLLEEANNLLKAALKDGGALEGLDLLTSEETKAISGGLFVSSNKIVFTKDNYRGF